MSTEAATKETAAEEAVTAETDPEAQDAEQKEEDKPRKEWEKRGDILALCVSVAMILWFQSVPLATMFGHAWYAIENDSWFHCETGGHYGLSFVDACICAYSQGVTCCFAPLSFCIMIIFVGRELLQKRLYYGLLKNKGVLQFATNDPLTDPLGIAVFVLYVHVILYFLFIVYATDLFGQDTTSHLLQHASETSGKGFGHGDFIKGNGDFDPNDGSFKLVAELFAFYILPATLFIVFFYCGYDIEMTLVPLSQYVHDAHDAGEEDQLSQLKVLDDAQCNRIVLENAGEILAGAGSHEEEYDHLQLWYQKEDTVTLLPKLGLVDSLWPANILLPQHASPEFSAKAFRILYYVYFGSSLFFGSLVLVLLGHYIKYCLSFVIAGDIPHMLQLAVEVTVTALCMLLLARLVQVTFRARHLKISRKNQ